MPRRIIRLLHQVPRLEFDECADEQTAKWREEILIGVLAPKFNRAGKSWVAAAGRSIRKGSEPR